MMLIILLHSSPFHPYSFSDRLGHASPACSFNSQLQGAGRGRGTPTEPRQVQQRPLDTPVFPKPSGSHPSSSGGPGWVLQPLLTPAGPHSPTSLGYNIL